MSRKACYHARKYADGTRYGQRVTVLAQSPRTRAVDRAPRNALIEFSDGVRMITSLGCLRWKCEKHA